MNKTTRLIANSNNQGPVEGQNRWYEYSFNEPIFIQSISIEHDNYSDNSEFSFELIDFNNKVRTFAEKSASDETYVIINTFAKSLKFKPPKDYFFQTELFALSMFLGLIFQKPASSSVGLGVLIR